MKISIKNLGKIESAEMDLRPFTVILGSNNTGKTYLAYSVYGLFEAQNRGSRRETTMLLQKAASIVKFDNGNFSIQSADLFDIYQEIVKSRVDFFKTRLGSFFQDSTGKIFNKSELSMQIERNEFNLALRHITDGRKSNDLDWFVIRFKTGKSSDKDCLHGSIENKEGKPSHVDTIMKRHLVSYIIHQLDRELLSLPFLLPAERNTLIISYKLLANRSYKYIRDFNTFRKDQVMFHPHAKEMRMAELMREQGHIGYPKPVEDFLDFLSDVELDRQFQARAGSASAFSEWTKTIEDKINSNTKIHASKTRLGGYELRLNVKRGLDIDLYNASSSIKQIVPLLLFLQHRAGKGQLLIVDEPEMNLHPETQAKVLEILAMLANAGLRVLITTHSPYFLMHLNNLAHECKLNDETRTRMAKHLYLKDKRAFLRDSDIGAYVVRDGTLSSLKDSDGTIRFDTLSDISHELQEKFYSISGARDGRG